MINKEIIIETLKHINHKGYVNLGDSYWPKELKLEIEKQNTIKKLLTNGKMATVKMGEPYTFEITEDVGVPILANPDLLNDDGTIKKSTKSKFKEIRERYWLLLLILTGLLTYSLGVFSPILTDIIKVQLPEKWFKRQNLPKPQIKQDSMQIDQVKDTLNVERN